MNDMTGNTGWQRMPMGKLGLCMDDDLTDEHGACLYRLEDGVAVLRPEEERRQDWPDEASETEAEDQTTALLERVDMLTECLLEMSEIVYGGE